MTMTTGSWGGLKMDAPAFSQAAFVEAVQRPSEFDLRTRAGVLGGEADGDGLMIRFYGAGFRVGVSGVTDPDGREVNPAVAMVLQQYVLCCPDALPEAGPWITYREFTGAGPLMGYFTANTNKILESAFADAPHALEQARLELGGVPAGLPGYDVSMDFRALPRVPVRFCFNGRDEEFPARSALLFRKSAEVFLDMKSMAIAGTWLAGNLITRQEPLDGHRRQILQGNV